MPRALITGITGQDGLYLAELLAPRATRSSAWSAGRAIPRSQTVERIIPSIQLLDGDLTDLPSLIGAMEVAQPDEVYNLGAISFVGMSWKQAELTGEITGMGVLRMLEAIRIHTQNDMSRSASTRRPARRCSARCGRRRSGRRRRSTRARRTAWRRRSATT